MLNRNLDAFQARIGRIAREEGAARQLIAGEGAVNETRISAARAAQSAVQSGRQAGLAGWCVHFVLRPAAGLALGGLALLLGRLASHHLVAPYFAALSSLSGWDGAFLRHGADLVLGAGFALCLLLLVRRKLRLVWLAAGFALMFVGEARVAQQVPALWQQMFSPAYLVQKQSEEAALHSRLRGLRSLMQSRL